MSKCNTVLFTPYNTVVNSTARTFAAAIDGSIGIYTNKTLTLNNFCIQYPNHIFLGTLEDSWSCLLEYVNNI